MGCPPKKPGSGGVEKICTVFLLSAIRCVEGKDTDTDIVPNGDGMDNGGMGHYTVKIWLAVKI